MDGEQKKNSELKRAGLRLLTEGLIQQNPLRDRPLDLKSNIFGRKGVERD